MVLLHVLQSSSKPLYRDVPSEGGVATETENPPDGKRFMVVVKMEPPSTWLRRFSANRTNSSLISQDTIIRSVFVIPSP